MAAEGGMHTVSHCTEHSPIVHEVVFVRVWWWVVYCDWGLGSGERAGTLKAGTLPCLGVA